MTEGTKPERLRLVARLNWDYDVSPEDLLDVIDGPSRKGRTLRHGKITRAEP